MKKLNNKVRERIMKEALKKALGVAAVVLGTLVTACNESESEPEPKTDFVLCGCEETEHWDTCECGADDGKCACTVIESKTLANGIRVYRGDGVAGEQMDATAVNVQNGWNGLDADDAVLMNGKVERIIVVSGANGLDAAGAKWIVKLSATQDVAAVTAALKGYLDTQIDPLCVCVEKNHLGVGETCECDGLRDCGLQVYGQVAGIPIYRNGEVSDTDMVAGIESIMAGYADVVESYKLNIDGKIREIHVVPTSVSNNSVVGEDGLYILTIRHNRLISAITNQFSDVATSLLSQDRVLGSIILTSGVVSEMNSNIKNLALDNKRVGHPLAQSPKFLESKIIKVQNRMVTRIVAGSRNHVRMG